MVKTRISIFKGRRSAKLHYFSANKFEDEILLSYGKNDLADDYDIFNTDHKYPLYIRKRVRRGISSCKYIGSIKYRVLGDPKLYTYRYSEGSTLKLESFKRPTVKHFSYYGYTSGS